MKEPKTYEIRTLADIFYLPTAKQMETALAEFTAGMRDNRRAADAMIHIAALAGKKFTLREAVQFPEVTTWIDDGKGEVCGRHFMEGQDEPFLVIQSKQEATNE